MNFLDLQFRAGVFVGNFLRSRTFVLIYRVWFCFILVVVAGLLSLWAVRDKYRVTWDLTKSLPYYVYVIKVGEPAKKGDILAFHFHHRDVVPLDPYPEGSVFTKIVAGSGGSDIESSDRNVRVDGVFVGYAKLKSKIGYELVPIASGKIPVGSYYVMAPHKDSYDSRYAQFGLVESRYVIGKAYPIF